MMTTDPSVWIEDDLIDFDASPPRRPLWEEDRPTPTDSVAREDAEWAAWCAGRTR
jgi:hypothetical protein